jgi:hypothetical protein
MGRKIINVNAAFKALQEKHRTVTYIKVDAALRGQDSGLSDKEKKDLFTCIMQDINEIKENIFQTN